MPPLAWWYDGREAILTSVREAWRELSPHDIRLVASAANRQPAVVWYLRAPGEVEFRALALIVLRVEAGAIVEITTFLPTELPWLTQAFGLAEVSSSG
jgi:RNA polymerase sigma-70 factor, ECF subfamily